MLTHWDAWAGVVTAPSTPEAAFSLLRHLRLDFLGSPKAGCFVLGVAGIVPLVKLRHKMERLATLSDRGDWSNHKSVPGGDFGCPRVGGRLERRVERNHPLQTCCPAASSCEEATVGSAPHPALRPLGCAWPSLRKLAWHPAPHQVCLEFPHR